MMATDLANVRAFFHLLPIEFSLPVVLVARLAKRTIASALSRNGNRCLHVCKTCKFDPPKTCIQQDLLKAATEELVI